MPRATIETYNDVIESVRAFNKDLEHSNRLRERIRFFQSWYYVPELDAVGPSKFIRYKGMTAIEYIRNYAELDGRAAEPAFVKWFHRLEENSPDEIWVRQRVDKLLGRYGKIVHSAAKFSAPIEWSINSQVKPR